MARRGARAGRLRGDRRLAARERAPMSTCTTRSIYSGTAVPRNSRSRSCSSVSRSICETRQNAVCLDLPCLHPLAVVGHDRPRAADDPHVRPDAAGRHRSVHRDHRPRWVARGGDWDLIFRVAVWGVGAGIVGARLYHLATSWNEVPDEWWGPFAVWEGGLGIWGGIAGGVLVGGYRRPPRRARASPRCSTRRRRASSSPRRSDASATGGTRSSSASRRAGPGASRSTPRAGPTSTSSTRRSTRRSSTRRSGTSSPPGCCCCSTGATASARRLSSRSTSCSTPASASISRRSGSIRRTRSPACA